MLLSSILFKENESKIKKVNKVFEFDSRVNQLESIEEQAIQFAKQNPGSVARIYDKAQPYSKSFVKAYTVRRNVLFVQTGDDTQKFVAVGDNDPFDAPRERKKPEEKRISIKIDDQQRKQWSRAKAQAMNHKNVPLYVYNLSDRLLMIFKYDGENVWQKKPNEEEFKELAMSHVGDKRRHDEARISNKSKAIQTAKLNPGKRSRYYQIDKKTGETNHAATFFVDPETNKLMIEQPPESKPVEYIYPTDKPKNQQSINT